MNKKLVSVLRSNTFKKILLVAGIIFLVASILISVDPEPFVRYGYLGVFVFNLLSGPGMLILPALSKHMNVIGLAFVTALGMAFNDTVSWIVGRSGQEILPGGEKIEKMKAGINKYGPWALLVWSMIPFPYDLIGLISGYLGFDYMKFLIPTFMGKFIRFLIIGGSSLAIFEYFKI